MPSRVDQRTAGFDRSRQYVTHVHGFAFDRELPAGDPVDVEQVIEEALHQHALAIDRLTHRLEFRVIQAFPAHQGDRISNRREWISQLVRQHRDEFMHALRRVREDRFGWIEIGHVLSQNLPTLVTLDSLGADVPTGHEAFRVEHHDGVLSHAVAQQPEALLALSKFIFVAAPLGEIPGDLRKADEMSRFISYRRDDHIGPETRAVFPDAPSFILKAALHRCPVQLRLGQSPFDGVRRIETRKMGANDLFGGIPFDMRRTRIPRLYDSLRIEHEDRVVLDACDQSTKSLFALP